MSDYLRKWGELLVCVCVCVCAKERHRKREKDRKREERKGESEKEAGKEPRFPVSWWDPSCRPVGP